MSELGQEANLLSEFDESTRKNGGYVEPPTPLEETNATTA